MSGLSRSNRRAWCWTKGRDYCCKARLPRTASSALVYSCHTNTQERLLEKSHPQKPDRCRQSLFSRVDIPCFLPNKVQTVEGYWSVICQLQSAMKKNKKMMPFWYTYIYIYIYIFFFLIKPQI